MARPSKNLYLRDGIYYARVNGNRWSTETANPDEAFKRYQFMLMRNQPWKNIKNDYGSKVEIFIDREGTHAKLLQYFADPQAKTPEQIEATKQLKIKRTFGLAGASDIIKTYNAEKKDPSAVENTDIEEPPLDCKDICKLLNYDYQCKINEKMPPKSLDYYRIRYDAMKRFVCKNNPPLTLDTFTKIKAIEYPQQRLHETVRFKGQLGFNNRPANIPTVNKEIGMFRKLWSLWKEEGRIVANPWARVKKLKKEVGDIEEIQDDEIYTLSEVQAILKNIKNKLIRDILFFQVIIGGRPGEEVLRLNREMVERGKIWSVKKKRWENFDYSETAKKFFIENLDGKLSRLTSHIIHPEFVKACKRAEVRVGKPYDFRKVFGTEALTKYKIETVQALLRHKDLSTTRKFYAKTRNTETTKAANAMQKKIFNKLSKP